MNLRLLQAVALLLAACSCGATIAHGQPAEKPAEKPNVFALPQKRLVHRN